MADSVSAELKARLRAGLCSKRAVSSQGLGGGRFFDKRMGVVGSSMLFPELFRPELGSFTGE